MSKRLTSSPLRGALFAAVALTGLAGCAKGEPAPTAAPTAAPTQPADPKATAAETPPTTPAAEAAPATPPATEARPAPAVVPLPGEPDPSTVVLEMAGQTMTLAQLDERAGDQVNQARLEFLTKAHEARSRALHEYVDRHLVEQEAKRLGLADDEAYLKQHVDDKLPAPSDEEVRRFYDENKDRMNGAAFEEVQPRIVEFLVSNARRDKFIEVLGGLRDKAGVKILLPPPRIQVEAVGPSKGPADAPLTMVIFSDFECPYCAQVNIAVQEVARAYEGKVRFVFRDFPLPFHKNAPHAAEVAKCADEQGKFWELHDALFANQQDLSAQAVAGYAQGIQGLDTAKLAACVDSGRKKPLVQADTMAAHDAGVTGTPAFFINGIPLSGAIPFEGFKEVIDAELDRLGQK